MSRSIDVLQEVLSYLLLLNLQLLLFLALDLVLVLLALDDLALVLDLLALALLALVLVLDLLALVLLGSSVARQPYDSRARTGRRLPTYCEDCRGSNTGVE